MRKLILYLLLVISVGFSAQKYVPFPTENAIWNVKYVSMWYTPPIDTTLLKYSLQGDTLINSIQYKRVCQNIGTDALPIYKGVGGLREQNKKIYYCGESYNKYRFDNNEQLLYDFTKQVGDTVWLNQYNKYVILAIDSVKIGNEYRKRYQVTGGYRHTPDYIIEGIGSVLEGLFGRITEIPTCLDCYQNWEFVCFSQNGESVYKNPDYVDCNSTQKWSEKKYFADDACWTYIKGSLSNKSQTFIKGDTLMNGKTYKKVFYRLSNLKESYAGAIREESGKVFANIDTQYKQYGEFMLYDFTVNLGDTIHSSFLNNGSELDATRIVTKIDTITLLNGEKRKKISFKYSRFWIEGIGSTSGLFYPAYPLTTDLDEPEIVCFKQNNTQLYKVPEFCPDGNCCDLLAGVPETRADLKRSTLLPNPTRDVALLQFTNQDMPCTSVEIADVLGKRVKTITVTNSSKYKLDLSDYAAGIYYLLVKYKDRTESHKIIKM